MQSKWVSWKAQYFKLQGKEGLLMSTSEGKNDLIGNNIQNLIQSMEKFCLYLLMVNLQ